MSSPVKERGARNTVATPSSSSDSSESSIVPKCAVCDGTVSSDLPRHRLFAIFIASGPEMRTTAMPPQPGGVDIAQIVSFISCIAID